MKEELIEIAEGLSKYKFRNSDKLLIPNQVIVKALEDAFKKGEEIKHGPTRNTKNIDKK